MDYPTTEKMREDITELKVRDTEQKIQIVNLREDITEIKESVKIINSNLEAFTKEMKNQINITSDNLARVKVFIFVEYMLKI